MERRKKKKTERTIRSVYNPFCFCKVKTERILHSVLLYQNRNFFLTPTVHTRTQVVLYVIDVLRVQFCLVSISPCCIIIIIIIHGWSKSGIFKKKNRDTRTYIALISGIIPDDW